MQYERLEKKDIFKKLFWYAVPLMIGNAVMLSYDLVDSIVISKFVGEVGLASVSNAGQISSLVLLFFYGLCMGASVIISEYYGADNLKKMREEVTTTLVAGLVFALSISGILFLSARRLFIIMHINDEAVLSGAVIYLRIACIGFPFVFVYNVFANALKAVGNSKVPTFFLGLSAFINLVLDLLYVAVFKWGVAGACIATVTAQVITCIMNYIYVQIKYEGLRFKTDEYIVNKTLLIRTFRDGMITALQQAVPPLGRTLIIAKVNTLGVAAMAANGILNKIDNFAILPAQNLGLGIMTYTAQCRGAKQKSLINDIFKKGIVLEMSFALVIFLVLFFFKYDIMVALSPNGSNDVINMGYSYLQIMSFGYFLVAYVNTLQYLFRGMGNMSITLYSSMINISIKVFVVYAFINILKLDSVAWGTIAGWGMMIVYEYNMYKYYMKHRWKMVDEVEDTMI